MTAKDYQVTFGYGATDGEYYGPQAKGKPTYVGPYHRGDDRAMPVGTPLVVNGVTIGLSGNGNGRYGPHLHVGRFVNGKDVDPHGLGFELDGAVVIGVEDNYSDDPVNARYVRIQDATGAVWVYLHMSEVYVKIGQKLEGGNMPYISGEALEDYQKWKAIGMDSQPYKDRFTASPAWKGNPNDLVIVSEADYKDLQSWKAAALDAINNGGSDKKILDKIKEILKEG